MADEEEIESELTEDIQEGQEYNENYISTRIRRNKQERSVRRSNMWMRRLKVFLRILTILLLMFCCYKLIRLPQWYLPSNAFDSAKSSSLEILNNKIVPDYFVVAALRKNEVPKVPIYMFDTSDIRKSIMQLAPVENVYIRRFWFPARLQIIVQERVPVITIAVDENSEPIAFFTKGGKLIGRDFLPLDKSIKTIKVLTMGSKTDDYRRWDNSRVEEIENLAKIIESVTKEPLEYIDLRNPKDIYFKISDLKIRLGEIDETVKERISRLPSVIPELEKMDKKILYLDFRWKDAIYLKLEDSEIKHNEDISSSN